ncbi:MAG TPA: sulfite exporter TauE/SafE family protein [Streptosporangiaceae bacterium]|nr:sulfite exporter TauE/SafE family protein [Streptosporangiaceae bacterium]
MTLNPALTLGSLLVGGMVGLTGMGGGALLTPMLMLVFGVPPLAAVSSDLVVSAITKPFGAFVHLRKGTVNLRLALWLSIGSVPCAFFGGLAGWWLGSGSELQLITERATGAVLIIAAAGIAIKAFLPSRGQQDGSAPSGDAQAAQGSGTAERPFFVRQIPTLLIGMVVGLAVGVTSTGSGTLVIAALVMLYPALPARRLVGTDLAQAVPMVLAAAAGHIIAGDVQMSVTAPLLIGGIPGVIIGSLLSSRAPSGLLRPVLSVVVLASGLSLVGLSPVVLAVILVLAVAAGAALIAALRGRRAARPAEVPAGRPAEVPQSRSA